MNSPLRWVGGKSKRSKEIVRLFPNKYKSYVEVFGGGASILFTKEPSTVEVFNDFDQELINFWKQVKENHMDFIRSFNFSLISRQQFDEYVGKFINAEIKDDLERAHIFYYLNRIGFAGDMKYPAFSIDVNRNKMLNLNTMDNIIKQSYERLKRVILENLDFRDLIYGYDSEDTFFYMDPPYKGKKSYRIGFSNEDYKDLASLCKKLKGLFLLTINKSDVIRNLFDYPGFNVYEDKVMYHCNNKNTGITVQEDEFIITNYSL